jgi:hypothetical protein
MAERNLINTRLWESFIKPNILLIDLKVINYSFSKVLISYFNGMNSEMIAVTNLCLFFKNCSSSSVVFFFVISEIYEIYDMYIYSNIYIIMHYIRCIHNTYYFPPSFQIDLCFHRT